MERADYLKRGDSVKVTIWSPDGQRLYESTDTGFHSLDSAISDSIEKANLNINPEDCVFEVSNLETGVSHRYRLNAHGNLKLIV